MHPLTDRRKHQSGQTADCRFSPLETLRAHRLHPGRLQELPASHPAPVSADGADRRQCVGQEQCHRGAAPAVVATDV